MANLKTYRAKRDFSKTPEPRGKPRAAKGQRYVIQKHDATRLHYDLRLELDGAMMSWAVTRGPSLVPGDKRLAIHVEDHPIEYNTFEGTIPKGEYGGGTVMVWDRGRWTPRYDAHKGMQKGHLEFDLHGDKLKGHWHLVRMKKRPGERQEPWLLIKGEDEYARTASDPDIAEEMPDSAVSGRSMEQIATGSRKVWHSNRPARVKAKTVAPPPKATVAKTTVAHAATPSRRQPACRASAAPEKFKGARAAKPPSFVTPCLATLTSAPPDSDDWVHEVKFDGYRMQARIADGKVSLKTRTGLDWTKRFPTIAKACEALADHDAILDGEIVSTGDNGFSDFPALQDDLKSGRTDRMVYYVFDLLHLDGNDLTGVALIDRKRALAGLLAPLPEDGLIRLSEAFEVPGSQMLKHASAMKLEGIVSKRRGSPYRTGRHGEWLKIKSHDSQEFVIVGYEPSKARRIRSLLLGYYEDKKLRYAGRVGTGWGDKLERDLARRLDAVARDDTALDAVPEEERRRKVKWVEPGIVVEIEFRGWTSAKLVRQASLKGVREDKPAKQVVRETPQPVATKEAAARQKSPRRTHAAAPSAPRGKGAVSVAGVTLTHPERVYWEDVGVTKQMLADYYAAVWDHMAPHVTGRVLALLRCPDGVSGQCFFQKHASAGIEVDHLKLVSDDGDKSIAIERLDGLIALAQAGGLEIHVRGSTIDDLEKADRLVFDLDPGPGVEWPTLIDAAREVRERLKGIKLESFVKTTGGKGLHVVMPIQPAPWDHAKAFCKALADQMAADNPKLYTSTIKKSARDRRIFIDYLRNSREATAIAPYSTRARPGATVSVPLSWQELGAQTAPNAFNVENLPKRLARLRQDPWAEMGRIKQRLPGLSPPKARRS